MGTMNRKLHIHVLRVPGESVTIEVDTGERKHDLTFKVGDIDFKNIDGVFNIGVEGTTDGDMVKGFIKGEKSDKGRSVQVELEKGNKKLLQTDSKKNTLELFVTVVPGESLSIEGKKNGESMWTYKTARTTIIDGSKFDITLETDMTNS